MANTGFSGVNVRQTANQLILRAMMQTSTGAFVSSGTTTFALIELQSDGTIKSYDFNDNTFKTTALTTPTVNATYRKFNNAATDTGLYTYALSTLTGFTKAALYLVWANNANASPTDQMREFQFGGAEGDLLLSGNYLEVDVEQWKTAVPDALSSGKLPADIKLWLTAAPASLSTNGYVQSMLLRWLTDNAAGTPTSLTANNNVKSSLVEILATALTETAGQIAGGFKKFFNVAAPVLDTTSINQTGDAYLVTNGRLPAALTANGNMKASLVEILTTALTETVGQIAGGFKKFFNVAAPTMDMTNVNQSGDAYPIWNTAIPGSPAANSPYAKLNSAAAAGDPLATVVPGAYAVNTVGYLIGNFLTGNAFARLGAPANGTIAADVAALPAGIMGTHVDGGMTVKQALELTASVLAGAYSNPIRSGTSPYTITVSFYLVGANVVAGAGAAGTGTVIATLVTTYSDNTFTAPTGRTVVFANLP